MNGLALDQAAQIDGGSFRGWLLWKERGFTPLLSWAGERKAVLSRGHFVGWLKTLNAN